MGWPKGKPRKPRPEPITLDKLAEVLAVPLLEQPKEHHPVALQKPLDRRPPPLRMTGLHRIRKRKQ